MKILKFWTLKFFYFFILEFWNFMKFYENWNFWKFSIFIFYFRILKFVENFESFRNFLWKFWIFWKYLKFWNFVKILECSLIDDEVLVFRINIKLLSNPVAELKIRENDSHCRSSLQNYGPLNSQTTGKGEK